MGKRTTFLLWAGSAACLAGAVDAQLGTGAVDWLVALCLTGPEGAKAAAAAPQMPMKHSTHALWFATGALGFAAASMVTMGRDLDSKTGSATPWSPSRRPVLAALVLTARAGGLEDAAALSAAYETATGRPLAPGDASLAQQRFRALEGDVITDLAALWRPSARRRVIVAALSLARDGQGDTPQMLAEIDRIAEAMTMDGEEIARHWDRHLARQARAARHAALIASAVAGLTTPLQEARAAIWHWRSEVLWHASAALRHPLWQGTRPLLARHFRQALRDARRLAAHLSQGKSNSSGPRIKAIRLGAIPASGAMPRAPLFRKEPQA